MANEPNATKEQDSQPHVPLPGTPPSKGTRGKIMPWLIPALTILVCAGAGLLMGRMFGTRGPAQTASAAEHAAPAEKGHGKSKPGAESGEPWFYDIEPIVANLNEPGVTRYVRVALTLEVGNGMEPAAGKEFLDLKRPLLKHWLTLYLSNQTLEGIRGEKNLRQVQTQITDALNQGLFPDGKPQIVGVLFKELSIQ
jgi:flagellar basal body-associated protein FliL